MPTLPIYVIGGFLGSGKTTLLKRLLAYTLERGLKPAVLMNEYGEMDVDGRLLHDHERQHDIALQSLLNGCVCCDLSDDLTETVATVLQQGDRGALFIETTGLANVSQVADGVLRALCGLPAGASKAALAAVVAVVDTPRFLDLEGRWAGAQTQFRRVDKVILNKMDATDSATLERVKRTIHALNPGVQLQQSSYAEVPLAWVLEPTMLRTVPATAGAEPLEKASDMVDSTRGFTSVTLQVLSPVNPEKLASMLRRYRRSVYRLKGFVKVPGSRQWHEVQWVSGALEVRPFAGAKRLPAHLVVIGHRIPWERFLDALDQCTEPQPQPVRCKPTSTS